MSQPGISAFGVTAGKAAVQKITLSSGALAVSVLTLGAILQSVRLRGVPHDLTLGSNRLSDYEGAMRYHGSLIGPVANRITGARATVGGRDCQFEANQDGRITLHAGAAGTHLKVWQLAELSENSVTLTLALAAGEGGFPGNRRLTARYSLAGDSTLRLELSASTDAETLLNMANHSYWNLDGTEDWTGHKLTVHADRFLPTTPDFTPTGEIVPVAAEGPGVGMDFRKPRRIAVGENAFDTNFCLSDRRRSVTPALVLEGQEGVTMTVATTEPGIQVYDGRHALRPGRQPYEGLAIEAQFWPDAPNHPAFPTIVVRPGDPWQQITEWRFDVT